LETLIADPNPLVEIEAMTQISRDWDDRAQDQLLGLTISDCPEVRQASIQLLIAHPASLVGQKLEGMVRSQNPWRRAAAVSILAGTRKTAALDQLSPFLADPSVLVRFTCATTLLDPDNGGKAMVIASMRKDPCEWLRNVVAGELAQGSR
jgi:HEAT repeat protein